MPVPFPAADTARLHEALTAVVDDGASPGGVVICGTTDGQQRILTAGTVAPECGDAPPPPRRSTTSPP
ncbi:hypothetical protein [Streptomyces sp. Ac-502]|uniref:hypothetical protein n=1 Tax=Streptomyces sp. Ac-502 TaxID=3342801 RepID=UPI0038625ADC